MADTDLIDAILRRAEQATMGGQLEAAAAALRNAKGLLSSRVAQGPFAMASCARAALLALSARDVDLATEFAVMVVSQCADFLESFIQLYNKKGWADRLVLADIIAQAFIPWVRDHPLPPKPAPPDAPDNEATWILDTLFRVRPKLDDARWADWSYPPKVERKARYWSARAFTELGNAILQRLSGGRDVDNARRLGEMSLGLIRNPANDRLAAATHDLMGRAWNLYNDDTSRREQAVPHLEQAIAIFDRLQASHDAGSVRATLGGLYTELATFAEANDDKVRAKEDYRLAESNLLDALNSHRECGQVAHRVTVLMNLGTLYCNQKAWDKAEKVFAEARDVLSKAPHPDRSIDLEFSTNFGKACLEQGKLDQAEKELRRVVETIEGSGSQPDPEMFLQAYGGLGEVLRRQGRAGEAYTYLSKGLTRLEGFRSSFASESVNLGLIKYFRWIYESIIACCTTLGADEPSYHVEAFDLAEKIKWRFFTVILRFEVLRLPGVRPELEPLLAEEERLLRAIGDTATGHPGKAAPVDFNAAMRRLEEIWTYLEPYHPDYVAIRRQKTIGFQEALDLLDEQVPVLVEYYFGDTLGTAVAFVLRRGHPWPVAVRLPGSPEEITAHVDCLRANVNRPARYFAKLSRPLYDLIIAPIAHLIPEGAGICIVPFGKLHNLPFAALSYNFGKLPRRNLNSLCEI